MKAVILTEASKVMRKQNGAEYVLLTAKIESGPLKDMNVTAVRTILNKDGEEKRIPRVNEKVTLHHTELPSATDPTKKVHFFEVQTMGTIIPTADNDTISAKLAALPF